jgi:hypothetical protein
MKRAADGSTHFTAARFPAPYDCGSVLLLIDNYDSFTWNLVQRFSEIDPRLSGTLWSAAVRVRGSRAQRRGRGAAELTFPRAFALARIRLTRTAAERGPVLSGACGQAARCYITVAYWPAFALRGRPLSAALSSPAPAARVR